MASALLHNRKLLMPDDYLYRCAFLYKMKQCYFSNSVLLLKVLVKDKYNCKRLIYTN
jgi:hypothetical protein